MLAALEAGSAYAPVDPNLPAERLAAITAGLNHPVLVTEGPSPEDFQGPVLDVAQHSGGPLEDLPAASPDDAAYIVFTSGSTGEPKGVVVERRNLAASTAARFVYYDEPVRCFLMLSPLSVDSSIAGLYWTLCSGGTLVLPPDRIEQDVAALAELIEREQVSHTLLVPSLWGLILESAGAERLRSLGCVVVAGEACSPDVVVAHHERFAGATPQRVWPERRNGVGLPRARYGPRTAPRSRSGDRFLRRRSICSTRGCGCCPRGCRARSASAANASPAATWGRPS